MSNEYYDRTRSVDPDSLDPVVTDQVVDTDRADDHVPSPDYPLDDTVDHGVVDDPVRQDADLEEAKDIAPTDDDEAVQGQQQVAGDLTDPELDSSLEEAKDLAVGDKDTALEAQQQLGRVNPLDKA